MRNNKYQRNITPERAREIAAEHGVSVSLEKAAKIVDFLYKMAILEVAQLKQK